MDLWSRWLDQPVESDIPDVVEGDPSLVGAAKVRAITGSTAAALSSDDDDQRREDDLPNEQAQKEATVLGAATDSLTIVPSATPTDESVLLSMALEDSSPNLLLRPARGITGEPQDDAAIWTKSAPPEEGAGNHNENTCLLPILPEPMIRRQFPGTDAQSEMANTLPFRTGTARPSRISPSRSSSGQHFPTPRRSRVSPVATSSRRVSQQYASRRSSYLSATTQNTGQRDEPGSWRIWEDRLGLDRSPERGEGRMTGDEEVKPESLYPCLFRRRNPARFNVRDHTHCAKTLFGTISELRLHITSYHRRQRVLHQCRRCKMGFESEAALDSHMMLPKEEICESIPEEIFANPEDGITDTIERQLVLGQAGVDSWEGLWRLVFPGDEDIPTTDFHPIIELVEVEQQFNNNQEALKASLQETLRLFLPPNIDGDFCRFLAGQLELTVETHRANTTRNCLNQFSTTSQHTPLPPTIKSTDTTLTTKSTRRSKRNTVFYSTSLPGTPGLPAFGRETDDEISPPLNQHTYTQHQRSNHSSRRNSRLLLSLPPYSLRPLTPATTASPHTPAALSTGDDQSDYDCSRESRDSGIGISCEACEMESCQCRDIILPSLENSKSHIQQPISHDTISKYRPKSKLGTEPTTIQRASSSSRDYTQKKLRHQPNLRIKTSGAGQAVFGAESPFSPQSFKQRVMRKQESKFVDGGEGV